MKISNEPLVLRTAIVAAVTAVIHALVVLGILHLTPEQEGAIGTAIDLAGAAVAVVWARAGVTPYKGKHAPTDEEEAVSE